MLTSFRFTSSPRLLCSFGIRKIVKHLTSLLRSLLSCALTKENIGNPGTDTDDAPWFQRNAP